MKKDEHSTEKKMDRRDVLKGTALGAAAVSAGHLVQRVRVPKTMRKRLTW